MASLSKLSVSTLNYFSPADHRNRVRNDHSSQAHLDERGSDQASKNRQRYLLNHYGNTPLPHPTQDLLRESTASHQKSPPVRLRTSSEESTILEQAEDSQFRKLLREFWGFNFLVVVLRKFSKSGFEKYLCKTIPINKNYVLTTEDFFCPHKRKDNN